MRAHCVFHALLFIDYCLLIVYKYKTFKKIKIRNCKSWVRLTDCNGFIWCPQGEFFFTRTIVDPMYGRRKRDSKTSCRKVGTSLIYVFSSSTGRVWSLWSTGQTRQLRYGTSPTSRTSTGCWYATAVSRVSRGTMEGCSAAVQMALLRNTTCTVFRLWWVIEMKVH